MGSDPPWRRTVRRCCRSEQGLSWNTRRRRRGGALAGLSMYLNRYDEAWVVTISGRAGLADAALGKHTEEHRRRSRGVGRGLGGGPGGVSATRRCQVALSHSKPLLSVMSSSSSERLEVVVDARCQPAVAVIVDVVRLDGRLRARVGPRRRRRAAGPRCRARSWPPTAWTWARPWALAMPWRWSNVGAGVG